MNVTSYVQQRQYGLSRSRQTSQRKIECFLETKLTKSFVNKPCEISGRCRSTFVMQFSSDGTKVASTHGDHSVRVTEIATGKCLHTLRGHPRTPWSLAYHPSYSNILASGCLGGQVRIWDLYGHGCETWNTENEAVVASLTFHPTDQVLVIAAGNTIYFWDWTKPEPFAKCSTKHEYERIRWIHFDSLGHTLYTGISNNISAHRDELSSVSHTGEEERQPSNQSSRLSSVYNSIVSSYEDYRRDRLLNILGSAGVSGVGQVGTGWLGGIAGVGQMGPTGLAAAPGVSGLDLTGLTNESGVSQLLPTGSATVSNNHRNTDSARGNNSIDPHTAPNTRSRQWLPGMTDLPAIDPVLGIMHATRPSGGSITFPEHNRQHGRWQSWDYSRYSTRNGTNNLQSLRHSVFGNMTGDPLLNPRNDPLLSSATESGGSENESQPSDVSGEIEIPLEAVTGQYMRQRTTDSIDISRASQQTSRAEEISRAVRIIVSCCSVANTTSSSVSSGQTNSSSDVKSNVNSAVRLSDTIKNAAELRTSHSINTSQASATNESSQSTSHSNSGANFSSHMSGYLQTFLQKPSTSLASDSTANTHSRVFPSIRERLQSSVPLCPVTSSSGKGKGSLTQTTGIPKVTVIMSHHTDSNPNVSRPGYPARTRPQDTKTDTSLCRGENKSCSLSQLRSNYEGLDTRSVTNATSATRNFPEGQVFPAVSCCSVVGSESSESVLSVASCSASAVNSNESVSSRDVTVCSSQLSGLSSTSNSSGHQMPIDASSISVSSGSHGSVSSTPSVVLNTPTVVASTSSHSTLFENIFHNSNTVVNSSGVNSFEHFSSGRNYLPTFRSQPCNWHNRSRYLSLMGPYLQSRGVNPLVSDNTQCPPEETPLRGSVVSNLQSAGQDIASVQRDQASSDTENELSAHLSGSGAYFMPIPEHQLRATSSASLRSSASLDHNTSGLRQSNVSAESSESSHGQRSESTASQSSRSGSTENQRSRSNSQEYEVELVVDQNENYTTNRNINPDVNQGEEIVHRSQDRNNNSIHISVNNTQALNSVSQRVEQRDPDYVRLRDSFVTMTDQIEREMNDLNRRINALRDSFNQSIQSLRHDRHRYETLDGQLPAETATNLRPHDMTDQPALSQTSGLEQDDTSIGQNVQVSQPPTLLETSLRTHTQGRRPLHQRPRLLNDTGVDDGQHWRTLQRHYLHPHYSSSILDETINRPNNVIQSAINRAIAGAFMGTGESGVANNIISQTHRIQYWDFSKCVIPDISQGKVNIVVGHCKLHNSASADISQDNTLLATFVPNHQGFPDNNILAVYSLVPETRGQCLYTKQFGPNAVSVSISPSNNYILVCLAARRLTWVFTNQQLVGHIYKLEKKKAGENSMKLVRDVHHKCSSDIRSHVSGNSACWLPLPGQGLVYGTNRGDLNICRPGSTFVSGKADTNFEETASGSRFQRLFGPAPWRGYSSPNRVSTSTQTAGVRRSAGTQTPQDT